MAESSDAPKVPQLNCRWAQLGPLAKLSVWAILLTVLVAAIEMSARLVHLPFSIFDKNFGSPLLVITALVSLLAVISTERRPLAEYGLTTPPDWFKRAVIGAGIGAVVYLAYCCFATFVGAFQFRTADVTPARLAKAALAAISSIPVAATQQIIFAGLLVGMLRQATTVTTAVLVPAAVFAAFAGTAKDGGLVQPEGQRLFVGMALVAAVLGLLRLRTGSIVFSTGVLAGAIAVRKVIGKLHLLELNPSSQWMP